MVYRPRDRVWPILSRIKHLYASQFEPKRSIEQTRNSHFEGKGVLFIS